MRRSVPRLPRARARFIAVLLAASAAASCGWHAGLVAPDGIRSIGVEVVTTNRDILERGFEARFTDALSRAVSDLVGVPLVAPADADAIVRGRIVDYRRRSGIRSTQNRLVESGILVRVDAQVIDGRNGAVLRETGKPSHVWTGYALGDDVEENEAEARNRALRHIADTLVLDLFAPRTESADASSTNEQTNAPR